MQIIHSKLQMQIENNLKSKGFLKMSQILLFGHTGLKQVLLNPYVFFNEWLNKAQKMSMKFWND